MNCITEVTTTKVAFAAARDLPRRRVVTANPARRILGEGREVLPRRRAVSWSKDQRCERYAERTKTSQETVEARP